MQTVPYQGLHPLPDTSLFLLQRNSHVEPSLKALTFVNSKRVAANLRGNYALKAFAGADTSDEELDAIWNRYFVAVNQYDHEIVDLRFELKDQLTREESMAVFSGSQGMQN